MYKQILICLVVIFLCFVNSDAQRRKGSTKIAPKSLNIHDVNFKKMKYDLNSSEVEELGLTQKDIEVMDTEYGDLTGDENEEAIVQIGWSWGRHLGSGNGTWIDIYTIENNKLKLLARFREGTGVENRSWKILEVKESQLILKRCDADKEDNAFTAIIFYKLSGKSLKQVKKLRLNIDDFPC
ncbi:MAG: hypothetical protein WBD22_12325 [Pyrinomonadaceae bacterium]